MTETQGSPEVSVQDPCPLGVLQLGLSSDPEDDLQLHNTKVPTQLCRVSRVSVLGSVVVVLGRYLHFSVLEPLREYKPCFLESPWSWAFKPRSRIVVFIICSPARATMNIHTSRAILGMDIGLCMGLRL